MYDFYLSATHFFRNAHWLNVAATREAGGGGRRFSSCVKGRRRANLLDRQPLAGSDTLAHTGFGAEVREALADREAFVIEHGLAEWQGQRVVLMRNLMRRWRSRELETIAKEIEAQTGLTFGAAEDGGRASRSYRRSILDLTRLGGHLMVSFGGVHNGEQSGPVHPGVQAADGGSGALGAHPSIVGEGVRPDPLVDLLVGQAGRPGCRRGRWRSDERGARGTRQAAA